VNYLAARERGAAFRARPVFLTRRFPQPMIVPRPRPVGAENLCHQAIFMNHAPCAVTPLDPELIQVCNAVG
jgi:hypothetical protein